MNKRFEVPDFFTLTRTAAYSRWIESW